MPKPQQLDPALQPGSTDEMAVTLQKLNTLMYMDTQSTDPTLATDPSDPMALSLQKINQLSYNRVAGGSTEGIPEAPEDGAQYVRQNGAWVAIKPPIQPFAPTLTSISPNSVSAGSPDTIITFTGTGFIGTKATEPVQQTTTMQPCFGDQLMSWYNQMINPVFVSDTEFQATLGANLLANPTSFFLWIQNTSGPDTNNLEFDVT